MRDSRPWLYRFLLSRELSANDIDDIAQDCMERLMRYHRCKEDELFLLLRRIAINRLADFRRSKLARMEYTRAQHEVVNDNRSIADPLGQAMTEQMLNLFHQALSTLPRCSREVYLLNRVDGMSYSQIARHRGVTSKTIEKQMSRALQDLRKKLNTDFVQFFDYS